MARGHERGAIYREDEDRERFLRELGNVVIEQAFVIHAYCLMTNHYHLLIETRQANLSVGMQLLNGRYGQAFNFARKRKGHLFEDRYKAILVEKESYLLELGRYVVLNPVRAGMARSARDYRWSNYRATAGDVGSLGFWRSTGLWRSSATTRIVRVRLIGDSSRMARARIHRWMP
jgi:REP element-mobilizing transposase RayT